MRVQIAIGTWNRAKLLDRTLNRMRQLDIPPATELEILIVLNACTDDTAEVIDHYREWLAIKSLDEPQQGHCHARNRAIAAADGDLMVWTDDDVLVDQQWIAQYVTAAQSDDTIGFWGGPIIPHFVQQRPAWIKENWKLCMGCFAVRDLGDQPIEFNASRLPYGANFAVRTELQKQFKFNTELGRKGNSVIGEDEVEMMRRMLECGHRGRWTPDAKVSHLIPPERATEQFVRDYFFGQGKIEAAKNWRDAGSISVLRCEAIVQRLLYRLKRPYAPSPVWLTHLVRSALAKGKLAGLKEALS